MPDANTTQLKIQGARGQIAVATNSGVFFKILRDGEAIKRKGGRWVIPLRNGKSGELHVRGILPGFQSLVFDGEIIHRFGDDVPKALRFATLLPLLLVIASPLIGMVLGVILVFLNVLGVANSEVPLKIRWFLPFANTAAGFALVYLIGSLATAA